MKKSDPPINVDASFNCSPERLWNALTRLPEMKEWYFDMLQEFEARKGFKTNFKVQVDDRTFTHQWEILEVEPGSKITYRWTFKEYPGSSTSTFKIQGGKDSSQLRLTIRVQEDFPPDIPEFTRESCIGGWDYFIHGNLQEYLSA